MDLPPNPEAFPRVTLVLEAGNRDDEPLLSAVLGSLSLPSQQAVGPADYEIVLVGTTLRDSLRSVLAAAGVQARFEQTDEPSRWMDIGAEAAHGEAVALLGSPGIASPTLMSSLCTALDACEDAMIIVRTFEIGSEGAGNVPEWLALHGATRRGHALVDQATTAHRKDRRYRWLDPVRTIENVVIRRDALWRALATSPIRDLGELARILAGPRLQIIGDALVRPGSVADIADANLRTEDPVDAELRFFGRIDRLGMQPPHRPARFLRTGRPYLSVIVVVHEMRRELPRTLRTLLPGYQENISDDEYEIVVVDNGSAEPLTDHEIHAVAPCAAYHVLADPPPSPAYAINYGVRQARGDALAILVDGACMLSPGVLSGGLLQWRAFPRPIVVTRYFMLGPGMQRYTIRQGYDQAEEDRLLASIEWPRDGHRLFEVASPLTLGGPKENWLTGWFESNCLFLPRSVFEEIGGCEERFDVPGGGGMNIDLFCRASAVADTDAVQLLGEAVFHQVHGGITSNTTPDDFDDKRRIYEAQYLAIRGELPRLTKSFYFYGGLRTAAARSKMKG